MDLGVVRAVDIYRSSNWDPLGSELRGQYCLGAGRGRAGGCCVGSHVCHGSYLFRANDSRYRS